MIGETGSNDVDSHCAIGKLEEMILQVHNIIILKEHIRGRFPLLWYSVTNITVMSVKNSLWTRFGLEGLKK